MKKIVSSLMVAFMLLTFALEATAASFSAPKNLAVRATATNAMTLTWSAVTGAKKYDVEVQDGKKWKKLSSPSQTTFVHKGLKAGTKYTYRVRATAGKTVGIYATKTESTPKKGTLNSPLISALKQTGDSIIISWKKLSEMRSMEIYRSTDEVIYKRVGVVTSGTQYSDVKPPANVTLYYMLRASNSKGFGVYGEVKTIKYTPPPPQKMEYKIISTQEHVQSTSLDDLRWEGLYEIQNTGNVSIHFGLTRFDLTDTNGRILKTGTLFSFPDILKPGEKGCFWGSEYLDKAFADTKVVFKPRWNISISKYNRVDFDLSDIEIRSGTFGTTVFGKIANNTGEKQTWAEISVLLYSKNNELIGVWMTNIFEDMENGVEFGFEISSIGNRTLYDKVTPDMVGRLIAYANTVQY